MSKFLLLLFSTSLCWGSELLSVGLRTGFEYADLDHACSLPPLSRTFVFTAETNGVSLSEGKLKKTELAGYSKIIELTPTELADIEVQRSGGTFWLKRWKVSGRLLHALFYGGIDQGIDTCFPPEKLASIEPDVFTFDFEAPTSENTHYTDSNLAVFKGTTQSGKTYRIEMMLIQDQL